MYISGKFYDFNNFEDDDYTAHYYDGNQGFYFDDYREEHDCDEDEFSLYGFDVQDECGENSDEETSDTDIADNAIIPIDGKSFIYHFNDGTSFTIHEGLPGVNAEMIDFVHSSFRSDYEAGRTIINHTDMRFENKRSASQGTSKNTINDFADPLDSIPSSEGYEYTENLRAACEYIEEHIYPILTPAQVDLVLKIYHERIPQIDFAEEQGVSRQAINDRMNKIKARVLKELPPEMIDELCEKFNIPNPKDDPKFNKKKKKK